MRTKLVAVGIATAATVLMLAPAANAVDPNSPEGIAQGFLQGIGAAFGSSQPNTPRSRQQSYIMPDADTCYREAARLRRPGVIAECNPLGGASGQYQLIVMS